MTRFIHRLAAFAIMWICGNAFAAEARAWLDRASMHVGETVTLNVEIAGDSGATQPDFTALQGDFELLGTQSSSSMSIVNGQASSKLHWAVGLQPRHPGKVSIPAFAVGSAHTEPLALTVLPAAAGAVGKSGDDLFVEFEATPRSPYVQQETRLTVKLYYALSLIDGNLEDPKAEGMVVRKLGQDSNYTADIDGRRYRVVERHYAAAPEKSGALELPAVAFRGRALDSGDMNSFFSRGRAVSAQSEAIGLDIRPRPAASGNDMWLPAQSLTLTAEGVDANSTPRVGEPLTLTVRLKTQGLGFEQLPELRLPPIDGADVYPDKEANQNRDDGTWIYGSRERKFAIVPSRPGMLTLPPLSIAWWDTEHDRAASAEVPSRTVTVAPASAASAPEPAKPAASAPSADLPAAIALQATPGAGAVDNGETRRWRVLALVSITLWIVTIIALGVSAVHRRRARSRDTAPQSAATTSAPGYEFRSACSRGDLSVAARALLRRARRDRPALRNLGELARAVADERQRAALDELECALYGGGDQGGVGERLLAAFRDGPAFAAPAQHTSAPALAPLYPFEIRRSA